MTWKFEAIKRGNIEGTNLPLIENSWRNDVGTTIIAVPSVQNWDFYYRGHGVSIKFTAYSDKYTPGSPLGQDCIIFFRDKNIEYWSNILKNTVLTEIKLFFNHIDMSPLMQGNSVKILRFSDMSKFLFGILGDNQ